MALPLWALGGGAVLAQPARPVQPMPAEKASAGRASSASPAPSVVVDIPAPTLNELSTLNPNRPLDDMPGIVVAWPDMAQPRLALPNSLSDEALAASDKGVVPGLPPIDVATRLPPAPVAGGATIAQGSATTPPKAALPITARKYTTKLEGPEPAIDHAFRQRFAGLSTLDANDRKPANIAQINRRAEQDRDLLVKMLKTGGYYDGRASVTIDRPEGNEKIRVTLTAIPGPRYVYDRVSVTGLSAITSADAQRFLKGFGVLVGDPVDADNLVLAESLLGIDMQESGYPFSKVGEELVTIDHATTKGQLDLPVEPGGKRDFGAIVTTGKKPFGADHVATIARFEQGDLFRASRIEDLRRALIATGLVSTVSVKPVQSASDPGKVDVAVDMTPAPPRTISGQIGYGTGEGFRAEAAWEHRNLLPPEGALQVRGVLGTREQAGAVRFRRNNFGERDRVLTLQALGSHVDREGYSGNTAQIGATLERQSNLIFQKVWTWSLGAELLATDETTLIPNLADPKSTPKDPRYLRRTYFIGALPVSLYYDSTDDWLDPTSGFRLGGRLSPEVSFRGKTYAYLRAQLDGSYYRPVADNIVLAARTRLGSIIGGGEITGVGSIGEQGNVLRTGDQVIPPSRRFYAGGGSSVRGYAYQSIGAVDVDGNPLGGKSLVELSLEGRIRLARLFNGNLGIVPFIDAGNVYQGNIPDSTSGFRFGAGVGARYHTLFGPIRVDVAMPLNKRKADSWIAVYVSLGQAF